MKELIYNLYLFSNDGLIRELGVAIHDAHGSDMRKLSLLQSKVKDDLKRARRFSVPSRYSVMKPGTTKESGVLTHDLFSQLAYAGQHVGIFEDIFKAIGASRNPLTCITTVIDGAIPHFVGA